MSPFLASFAPGGEDDAFFEAAGAAFEFGWNSSSEATDCAAEFHEAAEDGALILPTSGLTDCA